MSGRFTIFSKLVPVLVLLACAKPIGEAIRTADPEARSGFFHEAVQEAGFNCREVNDLREYAESSWRVSCTEGYFYLAVLDTDSVEIEPLPYFDPPTPALIEIPERVRVPIE